MAPCGSSADDDMVEDDGKTYARPKKNNSVREQIINLTYNENINTLLTSHVWRDNQNPGDVYILFTYFPEF